MTEQPMEQRLEAEEQVSEGQSERRTFLKKSGRVAIAAPAVVLLLSAGTKSAVAAPYGLPSRPIG